MAVLIVTGNDLPWIVTLKCQVYGLEEGSGQGFDPTPLIYSGISQVQRAPLELTGRGVVIGFLDTGIRYDDPKQPADPGRCGIIRDQIVILIRNNLFPVCHV